MHVHRGYVLPQKDVDKIHIAQARHKRGDGSGTFLCYKIGDIFILHYPGRRFLCTGGEAVWSGLSLPHCNICDVLIKRCPGESPQDTRPCFGSCWSMPYFITLLPLVPRASSTCIRLTSCTPSCVISLWLVHTMRRAPLSRVLYTARMPTIGALSSNV